jgi:putative membrane protein (TIGR04086 family)
MEARRKVDSANTRQKKKAGKRPGFGWVFAGIVFLILLMTAGLFFLWAWISYQRRFSTELIRVGLIVMYSLPCLLGGRLLTRTRCVASPAWGVALGACTYAVLFVLSCVEQGGVLEVEQLDAMTPLLYLASGGLGGIRIRKTERNP